MSEIQPAQEGFGRYLAQQRELRGMSLQAVSDETKLSVATLKSLEADDFARLPERVFLVGFVKAYARSVGLSPEETVLRLQEAMGPEEESPVRAPRRSSHMGWLWGAGLAVAGAAGIFWALHH